MGHNNNRLTWVLIHPPFSPVHSDTGFLVKVRVRGKIFETFLVSSMTDLWTCSWTLTANSSTGRTVALDTLEGSLVKCDGVSYPGGSVAEPGMPQRHPFFWLRLRESISIPINLSLACSSWSCISKDRSKQGLDMWKMAVQREEQSKRGEAGRQACRTKLGSCSSRLDVSGALPLWTSLLLARA